MPICPIYGFGAILIIATMMPFYDRGMWYLVWILGIVLTSSLEYLTSYVLEVLFHMRWWDYSKRKWNLNGRICLLNSFLFGCLVMIVMYGIQPYLFSGLSHVSTWILRVVAAVIVFLTLVDTVFSTVRHLNISKLILKFTTLMEETSDLLAEKKATAKAYLSNTHVAKKLRSFLYQYPELTLRIAKKKRMRFKEIVAKYFSDRNDE